MREDKLILIFSQEMDETTDAVIDWIAYYNYSFLRVNPTDLKRLKFNLNLSKRTFQIENSAGKTICSNNIHSVWFRRMHPLNILNDEILDQNALIELNFAIKTELFNLYACFEYCLHDKYWINKFSDIKISKIYQLICASQAGLLVPATHIVNSKDSLADLVAENNILSKAIDYMLIMNSYASYSSRITNDILKNIPDVFFPSLIQTEIEKEIELRIVYLEGVFYTMAIFSQQNSQTQVDFRKYDFDYPNRLVRYNLPYTIKMKLLKLMKKLGLNFGSIDMIKAKNGEYYFLEVNPVGQFGMVSHPCNFSIEKHLAELLISKNEKNN
jgi:ATP-GRASP peptide maturase of grasp-with-spasm system